ncbi:hypothetical protein CRENBAI_011861, partial [Crenichthys baileyi]
MQKKSRISEEVHQLSREPYNTNADAQTHTNTNYDVSYLSLTLRSPTKPLPSLHTHTSTLPQPQHRPPPTPPHHHPIQPRNVQTGSDNEYAHIYHAFNNACSSKTEPKKKHPMLHLCHSTHQLL